MYVSSFYSIAIHPVFGLRWVVKIIKKLIVNYPDRRYGWSFSEPDDHIFKEAHNKDRFLVDLISAGNLCLSFFGYLLIVKTRKEELVGVGWHQKLKINVCLYACNQQGGKWKLMKLWKNVSLSFIITRETLVVSFVYWISEKQILMKSDGRWVRFNGWRSWKRSVQGRWEILKNKLWKMQSCTVLTGRKSDQWGHISFLIY